MQEELLKLENDFARAVTNNDADAVDGFLSDDSIIVDPDGGIIDKARFLAVIKSGALSHEMMESADLRVRLFGEHRCGDRTDDHQREIHGAGFHVVRTGNRYFCEAKRPLALRIHAANSIHQKVKPRQRTLKLAQYRCARRARLTMRWS
jgi:Domain of unknown function (DUF4440)